MASTGAGLEGAGIDGARVGDGRADASRGAADAPAAGARGGARPGGPARACHDLLVALAGRLPDRALWRLRDWLAADAVVALRTALPRTLLRHRVGVTETERALLREAVSGWSGPVRLADAVLHAEVAPEPTGSFTEPGRFGWDAADLVLRALLPTVGEVGEVRRAWRTSTTGGPARVVLVSAAGDLPALTGAVQRALRAHGGTVPASRSSARAPSPPPTTARHWPRPTSSGARERRRRCPPSCRRVIPGSPGREPVASPHPRSWFDMAEAGTPQPDGPRPSTPRSRGDRGRDPAALAAWRRVADQRRRTVDKSTSPADRFSTERSPADRSPVEPPVVEAPVVEAPGVEAAVVADPPAADPPVAEAPVVGVPVVEAPVAEADTADQPVVTGRPAAARAGRPAVARPVERPREPGDDRARRRALRDDTARRPRALHRRTAGGRPTERRPPGGRPTRGRPAGLAVRPRPTGRPPGPPRPVPTVDRPAVGDPADDAAATPDRTAHGGVRLRRRPRARGP